MYNSLLMLARSTPPNGDNPKFLSSVVLFQRCAEDREDSAVWTEFLERYTVRIKYFIRGMLRQVLGSSYGSMNSMALGGTQESDLFQNVIVRLVENNCSAMRRFSGSTEDELLAYLAVISRSVVMDAVRRHQAAKRRPVTNAEGAIPFAVSSDKAVVHPDTEREILTRELMDMAYRFTTSHPGEVSARDRLVFDLHFLDGLSLQQISQCHGINLSKGGVEKLINRMVSRVQTLASTGKPEATLP
jgi:RNA polymerase sigma factor (sigma-70 family)